MATKPPTLNTPPKSQSSSPRPTVSHNEDIDFIKTPELGHHSPSSSDTAYAEHGAGIDHDIHPQQDEKQAEPDLWWSRVRHRLREPLAEFFGVFVMILFGCG